MYYCPMSFIASDGKFVVIWIFLYLHIMCCFSLAVFEIAFSNCIIMCFIYFFEFILVGFHWASWNVLSPNLGNFQPSFFQLIFFYINSFLFFFYSFSDTDIRCVDIVPKIAVHWFQSFYTLFFRWNNFYWSILKFIDSSVNSILLLSPPSEFSSLIFFSSNICILFFYSSSSSAETICSFISRMFAFSAWNIVISILKFFIISTSDSAQSWHLLTFF